MKRNMDFIRELLLKLEGVSEQPGAVFIISGNDPEIAIDGYTPDQITYHLELLREAGLIESPGSQPMLGVTFERLSWHGHDFLDTVRYPSLSKDPMTVPYGKSLPAVVCVNWQVPTILGNNVISGHGVASVVHFARCHVNEFPRRSRQDDWGKTLFWRLKFENLCSCGGLNARICAVIRHDFYELTRDG